MKPVVFLDIDGVLNSPKNYAEWTAARSNSMSGADDDQWVSVYDDPHIHLLFDEELVGRLNKITSALGADIVVSSSWRHFYTNKFDLLRKVLKQAGVEADVVGPTPTYVYDRGDAIRVWLYQNRKGVETTMVILDDFDEGNFRAPDGSWDLSSFLVQTSGTVGLQDHDVVAAVELARDRVYYLSDENSESEAEG